jgi:hypothetical protein
MRRRVLLFGGLLGAPPLWAAEDHTGGDPLGSMQWPTLRRQLKTTNNTVSKLPKRKI